MAFAEGTDLGMNGLLLFQKHASHLQVSNSGKHRALHDGSTLIILDVSHPDRLLECDFFCKTLLLEVSNRVIIGICEEMHNV